MERGRKEAEGARERERRRKGGRREWAGGREEGRSERERGDRKEGRCYLKREYSRTQNKQTRDLSPRRSLAGKVTARFRSVGRPKAEAFGDAFAARLRRGKDFDSLFVYLFVTF